MNFQFSLILEYCPHGNIKNYLITHRNQFWASVVAYGSTRSPNLDNAISIDFKRPSPFTPEGTESRHTLPLLGIWAYQVNNLFVIYHSIRKIIIFWDKWPNTNLKQTAYHRYQKEWSSCLNVTSIMVI